MPSALAVECPCGQLLEAADEDALIAVTNKHAAQRHAGDSNFSELDIMALIDRAARETDSG